VVVLQNNILEVKGDKEGKKFLIDLNNPVQVRYELIRECMLSGLPIEVICKKYGYSRQMYYFYKKRFEEKNWEGLVSCKTGPKKQRKIMQVEDKILHLRFKDPSLNMYDICDILREKNYDISPRTVAVVLRKHGITLKKTKKRL
jgi:transposase